MYPLIRAFLFLFDPEKIHHFTARCLRLGYQLSLVRWYWEKKFHLNHPDLERELFGLRFRNPVGLAAGFDKDATMYREMGALGFGFIEIGTLTPKAQPGNERPRLFRLKEDQAIINRMGFNNGGVEAAALRLKKERHGLIVGGNIGKNKVTPNEEALNDYLISFEILYPHVDYFVVNVSSPNTPNLRDLQEKEPLKRILNALMQARKEKQGEKAILLKIAPDLTESQLDDIIEIVTETGIHGVIATNTTISREGLQSDSEKVTSIGAGGLSGKPLVHRSTEVIRYLAKKSGKAFPIIGVGGIHSAQDALEKLEAGADLVQLYTGFIYEGPSLIKKINQAILEKRKNR
ncbi:MAG: quinone-dependent dihydroorotate dehydrogenase [Bacteroidetes bacterium]|nr:MAG: quinone-dependent dihydroorotate dehydrogenase [Bacteroidota bacterium]